MKYKYKLIPNFFEFIVNFKDYHQYNTYSLKINQY